MTCEEVRPLLAAYVLGALDAVEADGVRAHLAGCPGCAEEGARSGATAALLELAPLEGYGPTPGAAAALDRLLGRVAAERRALRRRRTTLAVAAAAAVAVLAGVVGGVVGAAVDGGGKGGAAGGSGGSPAAAAASPPASASPSGPAAAVLHGHDDGTGVTATVAVSVRAWGTGLHLDLAGVPEGLQCSLVAVARDGRRQVAATWSVPSGGYDRAGLSIDGAVGLPASAITSYVVQTLDGTPLVRVHA